MNNDKRAQRAKRKAKGCRLERLHNQGKTTRRRKAIKPLEFHVIPPKGDK